MIVFFPDHTHLLWISLYLYEMKPKGADQYDGMCLCCAHTAKSDFLALRLIYYFVLVSLD